MGMAASECLAACFYHHSCIPVSIGKGAQGLAHKFKALLHQLWVECGDVHRLANICKGVVSFCTDLGTEAGLASTPLIAASAALPQRSIPLESLDEEDNERDEDAELGFCNSMLAPGVMHILSNLLHDMAWALPHFQLWYSLLKALAKFLNRRDNRDRMRHIFWAGTQWESLADNCFESSCPSVAEWRWHLVIHVLNYLLPTQSILQATWDLRAFKAKTTFKDEDGETLSNLALVTEAIKSDWF